MPKGEREAEQIEDLFQALLRAGEDRGLIETVLLETQPSDEVLCTLLRRPVSSKALQCLASLDPWRQRPRVLGAIAMNPRVERNLALRLLPALYWRDLAVLAASPWVHSALRQRAEALLKDALADLRLGERITLARMATPPVLASLLQDADAKVVRAALVNPRLRETDLLLAIRDTASRLLLEATAGSERWREVYGVRLALVLQPRTPLSLALGQVSALVARDLRRVAGDKNSPLLIRAVARRLLENPAVEPPPDRPDAGEPAEGE